MYGLRQTFTQRLVSAFVMMIGPRELSGFFHTSPGAHKELQPQPHIHAVCGTPTEPTSERTRLTRGNTLQEKDASPSHW